MLDRQKILVVDDDSEINDSLCTNLERSGFIAESAANAETARARLQSGDIDLIILDIMMPGEDGLSLCRSIRENDGTPVILLTALADDTDRIVGLEMGADDYVTKPFNPRELVARIRAVLRRVNGREDYSVKRKDFPEFGHWRLNESQSELTRNDGLIVSLSSGELKLLLVLLAHPNEVLSRDDLMRLLQGRETHAYERSIDNTISRLRRKVEIDASSPRLIKTVRGDGYKLVTNSDDIQS